MEEIIKRIVEADRDARARVTEKKLEKSKFQETIADKRAKLKMNYQEEAKHIITEKRAAMNDALLVHQKEEEAAYEQALTHLQKHFDAHKDEWIEQMVAHCLEA